MVLRTIVVLFALLVGINNSIHAEHLSTGGDCSPIIVGSIIGGSINISCTDKKLEAKLQVALRESIQPLQNQMRHFDKDDRYLHEQLRLIYAGVLLEKKQVEVVQRMASDQRRVVDEEIRPAIVSATNRFERSLHEIRSEFGLMSSDLADVLNVTRQTFGDQIESLNERVTENGERLGIAEIRLEQLAGDISFLMRRVLAGELSDNLWFAGVTVGWGRADGKGVTQVGLESEMLASNLLGNLKNSSIYAAYSRLNAPIQNYFKTIEGAGAITRIDRNDFDVLRLGSRHFSWLANDEQVFHGPFLGVVRPRDSEQSLKSIFGYSGGWEINKSRARIALTLEAMRFPIRSTNIAFSSVGDSSIQVSEKQTWSVSLALRTSFR
jgi:hypothetical protein